MCLGIHIYIQYMWSALGLVQTQHLMLQCQDSLAESRLDVCASWQQRACLCVGGGRSGYLCSGVSQTAPHALRGFSRVRNLPTTSDLCRPAAAALTSVHVPVMCQLLQSRSCVLQRLRGSTEPSKGLKQRWEYMLSLPEKAACQRFASHRRRRSVHLAMLSLLWPPPPPDEAGAAAKDAWLIAETLRTKLLAAMSENLGFLAPWLFQAIPRMSKRLIVLL